MQDDRQLPVTPAPRPDEEGERTQSSNLQTEDQGEQVMQQGDPRGLLHQGLSLTSATASSLLMRPLERLWSEARPTARLDRLSAPEEMRQGEPVLRPSNPSGLLAGLDQGGSRHAEGRDGPTVQPRRLEPYLHGDQGEELSHPMNPFWSPEVRQMAMGQRPMGTPVHPGMEKVSQDQGRVRARVQEIENARLRILEEAERSFMQEVQRIGAVDGSQQGTSYHTAMSSGASEPVPPPPPPVPQHGMGEWVWLPHTGGAATPPPPPPPCPPAPPSAPRSPGTAGEPSVSMPSINVAESMRSVDLPALPPASGDSAALMFGDWLTMITPLMRDIAGSSRGWWETVVTQAETAYNQWLVASPLEKLRLKPSMAGAGWYKDRVEQRGLSMLLASVPESIRKELVSSRRMTSTEVVFRLFQVYQPGGASERANLLRNLADTKVGSTVPDVLQTLRLWRRWLTRAEELQVSLPDSLVLLQVLNKVAGRKSRDADEL